MLFFFSDLAVTRNRFVVPESMDWLWGLPLYCIAQLFLAYSVVTVIATQNGDVKDGSPEQKRQNNPTKREDVE